MHTNIYNLINDDDSYYASKTLEGLSGTNTLVINVFEEYYSLKIILKLLRTKKEPRVILVASELMISYLDHKAIIRECQIQHKTLYTVIKASSKNSIPMMDRISSLYETSFSNEEVRRRLDGGISLGIFNKTK